MTCLALGRNAGGRGAVGLINSEAVGEANAFETPPLSSDASAILPMPTPQSEKNCLRVIRRRSASDLLYRDGSNAQLMILFLSHCLIEVKNRPANRRPRRQFRQIDPLGRLIRISQRHLHRIGPLLLKSLQLRLI